MELERELSHVSVTEIADLISGDSQVTGENWPELREKGYRARGTIVMPVVGTPTEVVQDYIRRNAELLRRMVDASSEPILIGDHYDRERHRPHAHPAYRTVYVIDNQVPDAAGQDAAE